MSSRRCFTRCGLVALLSGLFLNAEPSLAANGMNAPGYGAVSLGMAGAGTALVQDAFATLRNPAAGTWLDDRTSLDIGLAAPSGGSRVRPPAPTAGIGLVVIEPGKYTAAKGVYPVPTLAINWRLDDRSAAGIGIIAAGLKAITPDGTATLARGLPVFQARCDGIFGGGAPLPATTDLYGLCGRSGTKLGVDLVQLQVSGHFSYLLSEGLSVGIAPVVAGQRIAVRGLGAFAPFSNEPDRTTDNRFDFSYGGGVRIGFLWQVREGIGLGAAYQSRLWQSPFDRYRGAIIDGSLDLAPTTNVGVQVHVTRGQRLLFDIERIEFGKVKPLRQQLDGQRFADECFLPRLLTRSLPDPSNSTSCLGGEAGPGFGWRSINVIKVGYQGQWDRLAVRAGFSWGGNPVNHGEVLQKVFAPPLTDRHVALGLSWNFGNGRALDAALLYAIRNRTHERNIFSNTPLTLLNGTPVGFEVDADSDDQEIVSEIRVVQFHMTYSWTP